MVSCCCCCGGEEEVLVEDWVLGEGSDASTAILDLHIHEIG